MPWAKQTDQEKHKSMASNEGNLNPYVALAEKCINIVLLLESYHVLNYIVPPPPAYIGDETQTIWELARW